jgi:tetratricopeptide (TPR) repeat protein
MPRKLVVLLFLAVWVVSLGAFPTSVSQKDPGGQARDKATHLQRGIADFEQGFYEFLPKNRKAEAELAFTAAIKELELALESDPGNREAHRTLARIHAARQKHLLAAAQYQRLTELDPFDLDSYALAAASFAEAGRFTESRIELEKAKGRTTDLRALALLDGYLAKLAEAEKQAGAGR